MIADRMDRQAATDMFAGLRRFEDREAGYVEEMLEAPVGENGLAVLTTPIGETRSAGVVFARSPGAEQGPLRRFEAIAARELARRGFPVVRTRLGPGRECVPDELSLGAGVAEAADAVDVLRESAGIEQPAMAGALLGAAAALLVAQRLELPAALICPVASGKAYLREQYRHQLVSGFVAPEQRAARKESFEDRLSRGPALVRGLQLTRQGFDELTALDLLPVAEAFGQPLLLLDASRSGEPRTAVRELAARSEHAEIVSLADPLPVPFGEQYLRAAGVRVPVDTRLELDRRLAAALASWAERL